MINEIFISIASGFKGLKSLIYKHFKEDYEEFIQSLTTDIQDYI